jgi:glycosyltransferase involved in cell wall biosynthesis
MLVKNESELMTNSLQCLKNFSDEIIVVDNGSTDNSVEIAKANDCKIIYSPNTILDNGRNKYLEEAKSDWIFVLDADEFIMEKDTKIIKNFCDTLDQNEIAQVRLLRYEYLGFGAFSEIQVSRLFRNHRGVKYDGSPIHSAIAPSIEKSKGKPGYIHAPIHHLDTLIGKNTYSKRMRYIKLLEDEILKNVPENIGFQHLFLGVEYITLGEYDKGLALFSQAQRENKNTTTFSILYTIQTYNLQKRYDDIFNILAAYEYKKFRFFDRICCVLAQIAFDTGKTDRAIELCLEGLETKPDSLSLLLNLAFLYQNNHPEFTITNIEKSLELNNFLLDKRFFNSVNNTYSNFLFQNCLIAKQVNVYDYMIAAYNKVGDKKYMNKWIKMKNITISKN